MSLLFNIIQELYWLKNKQKKIIIFGNLEIAQTCEDKENVKIATNICIRFNTKVNDDNGSLPSSSQIAFIITRLNKEAPSIHASYMDRMEYR